MAVTQESYKLLVENSHFTHREEMDKHIKNHRNRHTLTYGCTDVLSEIARITSRYPIGAKECRYEHIAKKLDMPMSSLKRHMATLQKLGIVKVVQQFGGSRKGKRASILVVLPYIPKLSENDTFKKPDKPSDSNNFQTFLDLSEPPVLQENETFNDTINDTIKDDPNTLGEYAGSDEKDNYPTFTTSTNKDTIKEISKKDDDYISKFQNIRDNKERHTVKRYSQLTAEERSNIEFEVYTSLASLNKKQFEHILSDVTKQASKLIQDGKEIYNYETYLSTACTEYMKNYVLKAEEEEAYKELMLEAVGESPNAFDDRNKEPKIDYSKIF